MATVRGITRPRLDIMSIVSCWIVSRQLFWIQVDEVKQKLWYEHREMCSSNTVQRVSIWFVKDTFKNVVVRSKTYAMFSGSVAQAPTALVTLTRRAWLVPVSKLTKGWIPLLLRMVPRFSDIWPHSPKAPNTLTSTSSGWPLSRPTRVSSALYSWNLWERKRARNDYSYACPKCFQLNHQLLISKKHTISCCFHTTSIYGALFFSQTWAHFLCEYTYLNFFLNHSCWMLYKVFLMNSEIFPCVIKCGSWWDNGKSMGIPWKRASCVNIALKDLSSMDTKHEMVCL